MRLSTVLGSIVADKLEIKDLASLSTREKDFLKRFEEQEGKISRTNNVNDPMVKVIKNHDGIITGFEGDFSIFENPTAAAMMAAKHNTDVRRELRSTDPIAITTRTGGKEIIFPKGFNFSELKTLASEFQTPIETQDLDAQKDTPDEDTDFYDAVVAQQWALETQTTLEVIGLGFKGTTYNGWLTSVRPITNEDQAIELKMEAEQERGNVEE